ncbi:hypothetical protein Sulfitobl28_09660 [Sulfitobacter pontiacus]|nr:hypothetical protein Sulfitobl28_09660 [Sulfitobacter pontiacus]
MKCALDSNNIRNKCLIYTRVSSVKQTTDGSGLSSQEYTCREFALHKGYEVVEVFTDIISGRYTDRPGMNALIARLKSEPKTKFVVVVDDISRLARNVHAHTVIRNQFTACGATILCPNQKFGEDASSRFIETINAAIAEHGRSKNAEQSHSRTIARMKDGYWCFRAPIGYKYINIPDNGKCLVKDEPLASIVREALNGFASGRFQSQGEVKRFLEAKSEFPKLGRRTSIHWDRVKKMLTAPVYAGYLEYKKWDIPRTKARHGGPSNLFGLSNQSRPIARTADSSSS